MALVDGNPLHQPQLAATYRAIADEVRGRSFQRGLEVGVGTGTLALLLAPQCREFLGIDINERALTFSRINGRSSPSPSSLPIPGFTL